jgi:putative sigma-54 modulation protein
MQLDIKGVHFDVPEEVKEYIQKKLHRLDTFKDIITDLLFTINHEKHGYMTEANINFRWSTKAHIQVEKHNLYEALDILFDKIVHKVTKEKEKINDR